MQKTTSPPHKVTFSTGGGGLEARRDKTVSLTNRSIEEAVQKAESHRRNTAYHSRSNTHSIMRGEMQESPEVVCQYLFKNTLTLPGSVEYCRDPNTGEVYGYLVYNTF